MSGWPASSSDRPPDGPQKILQKSEKNITFSGLEKNMSAKIENNISKNIFSENKNVQNSVVPHRKFRRRRIDSKLPNSLEKIKSSFSLNIFWIFAVFLNFGLANPNPADYSIKDLSGNNLAKTSSCKIFLLIIIYCIN